MTAFEWISGIILYLDANACCTPKPEREIAMTAATRNRISHLLIFHGRSTCIARKPKHGECVMFDICPSRDI